jgi:hypothetical protein
VDSPPRSRAATTPPRPAATREDTAAPGPEPWETLDSAAARAEWIAGLSAMQVLARSRTTETTIVELPGGRRAVRKRWWWPRAADRAKGVFRTTVAARSPARREFEALTRLRALQSGAFAPRPLVFGEERTRGVLRACALVLDEIEDAVDLAVFLGDERSPRRRAAVLADLAARVRAMHDAGLVDRDLHPRNVLVAGGRTWKVDCPKQRAGRGAAQTAPRLDDLAALDVGLVRLATPEERAAFLAAALPEVPTASVLRALDRRRARIDARESKRLPPAPGVDPR